MGALRVLMLFSLIGIYGLNVASQRNAELQKQVEQKRKDGRIVAVSGRVTNNETKLNEKVRQATLPTLMR